ncbi:stage III sporulation protein AG [Lachnospiraceae bacterium 38-14]|uniref:stage III sporulation protein AG n=1 Tax=Roseburia sp. 1XD42-69 TaxID=2320088 RepID=UPI000EA03B59|nr:stage III sporulation protein AG [Roseburia sp. 1XD42-69]MCX4318301.1 stage III sporulation protein AG [Lachnospiraceae bacterium]RKJ66562.1 stage III sporulation protein AG [Roseburia sp. 1XD42-69]
MDFKSFFKNHSFKQWDKTQWTILILAGILLMVIAIPTEEKRDREVTLEEREENVSLNEESYAESLERRLQNKLSKIEGAGRVEVMITLENYGESVVEKDNADSTSRRVQEGAEGRNTTEETREVHMETVYQDADRGKEPFVGSEKTPKIAGVLVVAQGADKTAVKQNISDAVMALFQIDVNRIKVVKMNIQEERQ